jgi:translation initiation factor 2B subunit (eIF-2B alpha/beta/delta family)
MAQQLTSFDADAVVVGADSILADGGLVNKVGTRAVGIVSTYEGIDLLVVAATDKISAGTEYDLEERSSTELYEGPASLSVANPTFDVTPAACIDAVLTEEGVLDTAAVEAVTEEH